MGGRYFRNSTVPQVVETSITNNSLSKDYPHPDDNAKQVTDTPGFKPFTMNYLSRIQSVRSLAKLRNTPKFFSICRSHTT